MTHTELVKSVLYCKTCMRIFHKMRATQLGKLTSKKKAKTSRKNGKLGGRPKLNKASQISK